MLCPQYTQHTLVQSAWKRVPHSRPRIILFSSQITKIERFSGFPLHVFSVWHIHTAHSRRLPKRYTNHYKHSMSNGIWVQLVMRFSSKRMCVVYTPWWFIHIHPFSIFTLVELREKNSKIFGRRKRSEKRLFRIFFAECCINTITHYTSHNA